MAVVLLLLICTIYDTYLYVVSQVYNVAGLFPFFKGPLKGGVHTFSVHRYWAL